MKEGWHHLLIHAVLCELVIPLSTILSLGSSWAVPLLVSGNDSLDLHNVGFMVVC